MRLCFGTFAAVLNHCRQNVLQAEFIARIVKIVDPYNSCIVNKFDKAEIVADGPATTKLLKCKNDFVFVERENANKPTPEAVVMSFETEVAPFIDEDKKAKVILALLDIIEKDKYIDFDKKENFKKYLGVDKQHLLQQSEFVFSDFLGRILLYSTCGNVDNKVGQSCIKLITCDLIDSIAAPYAYEYQWDTTTQTLVLSFVKIFNIFNQAILDYHINNFIETVDPTNMMETRWVEKCENFLNYTKDKIWIPFGSSTLGMKGITLQKVQQFAQVLDEYTKYLPLNMRPENENSIDRFVPLFRDENVQWAMNFEKETINYRQQLISIHKEIYHHMLFSPDFTT